MESTITAAAEVSVGCVIASPRIILSADEKPQDEDDARRIFTLEDCYGNTVEHLKCAIRMADLIMKPEHEKDVGSK